MNYISVAQAAEKWQVTPKRVQVLCSEGRIEGAQRVGNQWTIPETAEKPQDARKKLLFDNPQRINNSISIERVWAMPNKNTFSIKPIHDLIVEELTDGLWIDPFANNNKLASVTNDLNQDYDTDYHMDALDFMKMFDSDSVDGVLYDPPYSPRQVSECYNNVGYNVTWDTTKASFWGNHKREISRIVKIGGKVLTFGWYSGGIGYKYGFEIERILLVPHGGWHNDTICTVEVKTHEPEAPAPKLEELHVGSLFDISTEKQSDNQLIQVLQSLPADFWDFKNDDVRQYTHGIHNYPAMMVSPISRNILRIMKDIKPIHSVLDPFMGSGTVLVESMLAGADRIYGSDINPFAVFLSKVKTTALDINLLQSEAQRLYENIEQRYRENDIQIDGVDDIMRHSYDLDLTAKDGWGVSAPVYLTRYTDDNQMNIPIPDFKNIGYWFKPRVILLLSIIKEEINKIENPDIRNFVFVAFSETIRFVSNRRNGEFKMFRMPAAKVDAFEPDVIKEFTTILDRNIEKMNSFIEVCEENNVHSEVSVLSNNASELQDVPDDSIDLVITSPPYGDSRTTVAYGEYSRLSLQWLDLFELSEKDIMGIDKSLIGGVKFRNGFEYIVSSKILRESLERIKDIDLVRAGDVYSFYLDLEKTIKKIAHKSKSGGYQFWVIGNRTVKGELLLTDQIITEIAEHYDMEHVYTVDRNIINKVMPSQNSPTNETGAKASTMTNEHIVILRKR